MKLALWIGVAAAVLVIIAHISLFLAIMGPDRSKKDEPGDEGERNTDEIG